MNISLFNISDPPNTVDKKLGQPLLIENVRFTEPDTLNVINPTILLDMVDGQGNILDLSLCSCYNYVYIPKYKRYYFITNISTKGGLVEISTKVDVLMSFQNDIYKSEQILSRCEMTKYRDKYIKDDSLIFDIRDSYKYYMFPQKVTKTDCVYVILETIGKGGVVSG